MQALETARNYRFHDLFSHQQVKAGAEFSVKKLYEEALVQLERFPGTVDAIVGYWDFPVSTLLPLLRRRFGLASPSYEAVLKCEHKYWCRLEQKQVIPEYIPAFCVVNPFVNNPGQNISLGYPFWIKPVKAASSHLGFMVRNKADFEHAIEVIRSKIFRVAKPFNYMLELADLPDEIAAIDGSHCIVEGIISQGHQCTLEGYVYHGEVTVYGAVDSIRGGQHRSSFSRYQYPSTIPQAVQQEMITVTARFLQHIQFDNGPFNIEFYWEQDKQGNDKIRLLEINTRISKSHCPLFHDVDGATHQKVMLELALGQKPDFPYRRGKYKMAAKFMWRVCHDAYVRNVPSEQELSALVQQFPDTQFQLHIHKGMYLSELKDQDSYSYEIAVIFLGGHNQHELLQKYSEVQKAMHIELEPIDQ